MRIEGQLERAEGLVASIEEAERDVAQAEDALEFALGRVAAAQAQVSSADEGEAEAARHATSMAEAAARAAQETLERAQGKLDAAHTARAELAAEVTGYVNEQGRAAARLADAQAAAPYGADALQRTRDQVLEHAALGNRVLQILGAHEVTIEGGGAVGSIEAADGATGGVASLEHVAEGSLASDGNWHDYGYTAGGVSLNQLRDTFRMELAQRLRLDSPTEGLLFLRGREERLVGFDEIVQTQALLDEYEMRLSGMPGGTLVISDLRKICDEELSPRSLDRPYVAAADRRNVPLEQANHCNPNPKADIEASYVLTSETYGADSPEAVDAAWRYAELLEAERASTERDLSAVRDELAPATERYYAFCDEHDCNALSDTEQRQFDALRLERDRSLARERVLRARKNALDARYAEVTSKLDPASRTRFVGLNGSSDFVGAYEPFITHRQGYEFDDVRGCCGIGSTESIVNEQLGSRHGWAYGIDEYLNKKRTSYRMDCKWWNSNGSTKAITICRTLREHGLDAKVDYEITPERIVELKRQGHSLGMGILAQDLEGPGLAPRQANDVNAMKANHAVTIAGVSLDKDGNPKVVWINDTGGWLSDGRLSSNRIPIGVEKFALMQQQTVGFAAYSAWQEPPADWDASAFDALKTRM